MAKHMDDKDRGRIDSEKRFGCHGRWRGLNCVRKKRGDLQMEFELLSG